MGDYLYKNIKSGKYYKYNRFFNLDVSDIKKATIYSNSELYSSETNPDPKTYIKVDYTQERLKDIRKEKLKIIFR